MNRVKKSTKDQGMNRCLFFPIPHIENGKARVLLFDGLPHFLLDDSISHTGSEKKCVLSITQD